MKLITVVVLVLVVIAATRAGHPNHTTSHATSARQAPTTTGTPVPAPAARSGASGGWVITGTYYDPEFGRRTVICMDAAGDLRTATGWREIDVPGGRIDAPCPTGRVLDEGVLAPLTTGGEH